MANASDDTVRLAMVLLERGFSDDRVQEALTHVHSLDEALAWLNSGAGGSSSSAAAGDRPRAAEAAAPPPAPCRRRVRRKVADPALLATPTRPAAAALPAPAPEPAAAPAAAPPMAPAEAPAAAPTQTPSLEHLPTVDAIAGAVVQEQTATVSATTGAEVQDSAPSAASASPEAAAPEAVAAAVAAETAPAPPPEGEAPGSGEEVSAPLVIHINCAIPVPPSDTRRLHCALPVVSIQPRDASDWWREAGVRYRKFMARAKSQAVSVALPAPSEPAEPPVPEEQPEPAEMPAKAAAEAAAATAADMATAPTRRPPATPCSAKRTQVVAPMPMSSPVKAPGKVLTPFSSPRAMRINSQAESCELCCEDVPSWRAVRLGCGHGWYCSHCVQRHTEARLEMGTSSITCPECCTPLAERDLRKMLPKEIMDRLLARSLEQAISSAADLWACPTPNCPMRVALGDGELPRLRCTLCRRDSCLRCSAQPYHKGLTCEEHAAKMREKRKRQRVDEDSFFKWMKETGTKQCPTCRMAVTKQNLEKQETQRSECHKMFCRNCNTRFCFKCLKVLTDTFTCKCTIDAHGFINPHTGRRLNHLRRSRAAAKERAGR